MKSSIAKWIFRSAIGTLSLISAATVQAQSVDTTIRAEQNTPLRHVYLQQLHSEPTKFRLHFNNPAQGNVVLVITDTEGNTLLHKKIEQTTFAQTFDLSSLKDGAYTFTLLKGKEVVRKTVQLNTDYVMVKKAYIK